MVRLEFLKKINTNLKRLSLNGKIGKTKSVYNTKHIYNDMINMIMPDKMIKMTNMMIHDNDMIKISSKSNYNFGFKITLVLY